MAGRKLTSDDRVYVHADLYEAGRTEDGTPYTADVYYIVVESKDGKRLAHTKRWWTADKETSPDGFDFFGDLRKEMKAAAEAVVERIKEVGSINFDHWEEIQPAYGSDYYCQVHGF